MSNSLNLMGTPGLVNRSIIARINCGGSGYTDSSRNTWLSDTYYSGGDTYDIESYIGAFNVTGTSNPVLYKFERSLDIGSFSYTIPITAGTYSFHLHFCENNKTAGQRIGTVALNGVNLLTSFDIYSQAGGQHIAFVKKFSKYFLNAFVLTITNTLINGIEIFKD